MIPDGNGGSSLVFAWGDKTITVRGVMSIMVLIGFIIGAGIYYSNIRVEQAIVRMDDENRRLFELLGGRLTSDFRQRQIEHAQMRRSLDLAACILLFEPSERRFLRGKSMAELAKECPFLGEER